MRREALATLTVLTLLTAGCIAAPDEVDTAAVAQDSPLLDALGAYRSSVTYQGDAIVLRTNASPAGGTAAFWWDIPEGVILGDEDDTWIEFLAAPVLLEEARAPLERWMLMAFLADKGGHLALNQLAFGAPFTVRAGGLMGGANEEVDRSLEPFLFGVGGELRAGGRVGFVVSGVASEDVEMALVLLPLQKEWDDEDVPEDTEQFLAYIEEHARVALPASGTGGAHQVAFHYEGSTGFGSIEVSTGPIDREGDEMNAFFAGRRAVTVSTGFASGGYGLAAAGYDARTASGSWSALADAHGAVSEGGGLLLAAFGPAVNGWPFVAAMGEGDAPASTSITVQSTNVLGDSLYLLQIDVDATLKSLLGLEALRIQNASTGGGVDRDSGDLQLQLGDVGVRGVGMGAWGA